MLTRTNHDRTPKPADEPHQTWIQRLHDAGMRAYLLSLTYPVADRAQSASSKLRRVAPTIFKLLISGNWKRAADRGDFVLLGYLDVPASSTGRISTSAAEYHHHCILLARPAVCRRLAGLVQEHGRELELTDIPETRTKLAKFGLQNCYLQYLQSTIDVAKAAAYVTKAKNALSKLYPDEAYQILP